MDITVLNLSGTGAFAEYFLLCSGRQPAADPGPSAKPSKSASTAQGMRLAHREGKSSAEWVLLDYGYFVVHIFSERAREYYDLERLWRNAERIDFPASGKPAEARGESDGAARNSRQ